MLDIPFVTEVLNFTFYQSDDESRFIIDSVLRYHKITTKKASAEVSPLLATCIEYLYECQDADIDTTADAHIDLLLLRLSQIKGDEAKRMHTALTRLAKSKQTISPRKVQNLKQSIKDKLRVLKADNEMRQLFRKCNTFMDSSEDADTKNTMLTGIRTTMEDMLSHFSSDLEMAETLNEVDFSDVKSIQRALDQYDERKAGGGFNWGWQGIQDWFEHCGGGWRLGQSIVIAGAADRGKSFLLRMMVQWAAMYNKPVNKKSRKRKLLMYACLESEIDKITHDLYVGAWFSENPDIDPPKWNNLQKSEFINKFYGKRGYVLRMLRYGSSELTYVDLLTLMKNFSKKYVIEYLFLDYVGIMSLEGLDEGNDAKNRQVLQARIRTYCARNDIRYATAAQLHERIKEQYRLAKGVAVSIASSSYLSDCTALEKETDIMIYVNVESNHLGDIYMTLKISRYRGESLPPSVNKRVFCMKFNKYGIPDDINGESLAVANLMNVAYEVDTNDENDTQGKPSVIDF